MTRPPFLSAVIPMLNEEENLPRLYERLTRVFEKLERSYEIVFVNDGSTDGTWDILRSLCAADERVRAVDLSRNFGHQAALTAGLDVTTGEVIVMLDADLQDPPELLPKMLEKYEEGFDIVYAVRKHRKGEGMFKRGTAALFYRMMRKLTSIEMPLDAGDFRLVSRRALESMTSLRERTRFLRGMFAWTGYRQAGVRYVRPPRFRGETKYPLRKMVRFAVDGITSFSTIPLQAGIWFGFFSAFLGFLYAGKVLYDWMAGGTVQGWASLSILILFFGGVQLITLGFIGEYIGRIFEEVKQRPIYIARETIGAPRKDESGDGEKS